MCVKYMMIIMNNLIRLINIDIFYFINIIRIKLFKPMIILDLS